jgi:hypothetical protein
MGIIITKQIEKKEEESKVPLRTSFSEQVLKAQETSRPVSDQPILIVDGKEKKVSKRSAYILDMLTLDDE